MHHERICRLISILRINHLCFEMADLRSEQHRKYIYHNRVRFRGINILCFREKMFVLCALISSWDECARLRDEKNAFVEMMMISGIRNS